jgi:hypothetical protein
MCRLIPTIPAHTRVATEREVGGQFPHQNKENDAIMTGRRSMGRGIIGDGSDTRLKVIPHESDATHHDYPDEHVATDG